MDPVGGTSNLSTSWTTPPQALLSKFINRAHWAVALVIAPVKNGNCNKT
jgi:hypothetical protein